MGQGRRTRKQAKNELPTSTASEMTTPQRQNLGSNYKSLFLIIAYFLFELLETVYSVTVTLSICCLHEELIKHNSCRY
jgi:hypothetical protein